MSVQNFVLWHKECPGNLSATDASFRTVTNTDDVVSFSESWENHVRQVRDLFEALRRTGLVVNLPKCETGEGTSHI